MREMGYIHCTPANVSEYDQYDIDSALLMSSIDNDEGLKKAREHVRKRKAKKLPKRSTAGNGRRRTAGQGNHLNLVQ